jgi:hypothetical protein
MNTDQITYLTEQLQNGNEQQRRVASYKLSKLKDPSVVPALISAFKDPDSSVRQNIIDGLQNIGSKDAIDFLNLQGIPTSTSKKKVNSNLIFRNAFIVSAILMTIVVLANMRTYPNQQEIISTWLCGTIIWTIIFGFIALLIYNTRNK